MAADLQPAALMLAPECPYPLAGGGALRTASLLQYLARKYAVDLIVFREPGARDPREMLPAGLVRRIHVIDLPANSRRLAARVIRNSLRAARGVPPLMDRFAGFGPAITAAVAERHYEVSAIEHFWCAPYIAEIAGSCRRTVLDLHNVESQLHRRCAESESAGPALAHRAFERAARRLERHWLPRFSDVLTASQSDAERVRELCPPARVTVYPNAIPATPLPPHRDDEAIVFSGNFDYHPNRSAVRFFRRQVWPLLRNRWPRLVWRLVGKNPEGVRAFTSGDPRIEVSGGVDDAVAELARSRVAIVPLLAGSGTRLKILEAWAAGLPVVSTSVGAEGLNACDGEHLFIADGATAFAAAVSRLLTCNVTRTRLGNAGRLLLENEFTWETVWSKLDF